MKKIEAIIQPSKLNDVKKALAEEGIQGMTVYKVKGFGRQLGHAETYHGDDFAVDFLPKVKLEVVVSDDRFFDVVNKLKDAAWTGKIGDGKLFVSTIDYAMRIRTGEVGENAV
jgi:nitrogen regulatory protein P-II 1